MEIILSPIRALWWLFATRDPIDKMPGFVMVEPDWDVKR